MIFNLVDRPDSTLVGFEDDYDDHAENDGLDDGPDCTLVVFGDLKMIMPRMMLLMMVQTAPWLGLEMMMIMPRTTVQTPNSTLVVFEVVLRARMFFVSGTHNGTEYLGNILSTRVMLR